MDHFRRIVDDDDDDDNNKDEEDQTSRSRSDFNPPSIIRDHSAFSKPILPSSSSLLSPKPHHHFNYATTTTTNHNGSSLLGSGSSPITPDPDPPTRYRDCHRNHAASLGGHVTDGCGEFMPAGPADQLKCAACGCHRSFHLKEIYSEPIKSPSPYRVPLLLPPPPPPPPNNNNNNNNNNNSHNITNQSNTQQLRSSPNPVRLSDQSSSEERNTNQKRSCHNNYCSSDERGQQLSSELGRKKRFRTKFSPEQKEKMRVFAERVAWRVQKKDEGEMERFCGEVGVSRQVLKVWMHNNKHLLKSSRLEGMQFQGRSEKVEGHEDEEEEEGGQGGGERGVL